MSTHSSLAEPLIMPEFVVPDRKIGRNEPCWCGSGKKFKKCHLARSNQPETNFFEYAEEIRKEFAQGYCSHPDASPKMCSTKVIRSHTIQKRGGLSAIAENGHVLSVKLDLQKLLNNRGEIKPFPVGINSASTFPGFCNRHDTEIFLPVEQQGAHINKETALLLAYRAVTLERFQKAAALRVNEKSRTIDRGAPIEKQVIFQNMLIAQHAGLELGLRDIDACKRQYDEKIKLKETTSFHYYYIEFDNVLPVCTCGAFFPEYDLDGNGLQKLGRPSSPLQSLAFNLTSIGGRTVAVFGWIGEADGPALEFCRSISHLPDDKKASSVINIAFEYIENTFVKPSWWENLSGTDKKKLIERTLSGIGNPMTPDRGPTSLINGGSPLWSAIVIREEASTTLKRRSNNT